MSCIRSGWAGGGGGRAGGLREPETQAAQPSAQELTETATVGIDDGKGRGGHREVISPAVTITALKTSRKPYHVETSVERHHCLSKLSAIVALVIWRLQ